MHSMVDSTDMVGDRLDQGLRKCPRKASWLSKVNGFQNSDCTRSEDITRDFFIDAAEDQPLEVVHHSRQPSLTFLTSSSPK